MKTTKYILDMMSDLLDDISSDISQLADYGGTLSFVDELLRKIRNDTKDYFKLRSMLYA